MRTRKKLSILSMIMIPIAVIFGGVVLNASSVNADGSSQHSTVECSESHDHDTYGVTSYDQHDDCDNSDHKSDDKCDDSKSVHKSDDCDNDHHDDCDDEYSSKSYDDDGHEHDICTPPPPPTTPVYNPSITAGSTCINDQTVKISGSTSGFAKGEVVIVVRRGDVEYASATAAANGSYSVLVDVGGHPVNGAMTFAVGAFQGQLGNEVLVVASFDCSVTTVPPSTNPPATNPPTKPTTPTTPSAPSTPSSPSTPPNVGQGGPVPSTPSSPSTPTTTPPTVELPTTGNGLRLPLAASVFSMVGIIALAISRWRRNWSKIGV